MPEIDQQEQQEQQQEQEQPPATPPPTPSANDKKALDLSELKEMNIQGLTALARDLGVEGAAGMKKHDLIFKILQSQTEKSGLLFAEGVLECLPTATAFCARRSRTICPDRTTSTSRPRRSGSSTCARATPSPARSGPQGG